MFCRIALCMLIVMKSASTLWVGAYVCYVHFHDDIHVMCVVTHSSCALLYIVSIYSSDWVC